MTKASKAGMTKRVNSVDRARPPSRMLPSPRYNSEPAPVDRTSGVIAKIEVVALMKMGLILVLTASDTAVTPSSPL